MTEYVTPMISSVLKKYQTSATKSLQGPAVALIKKEILSSPEPHELHSHHHQPSRVAAGLGNNSNSNSGSSSGGSERSQIYAPLPPELSQPILSQPDSGCGELYETRLEGKTIGCFSLGGEMRLCLPQFLNNVLNDFTLEEINRIFDELGIYCSQCTPDQLVEFKAAKILPSDVKASGLITRTDAERLCAAMLQNSDRNSYVPVECLPKGALSFQVYHKCFGKCEGICTPDMYSYQKPTCIKCLECEGWFSPQKFVGHVHRKSENRTCHWGFDSRNWHDYLHVALDVENREKYQRILDQLKEVELKEMHKAQCELDHKKRKSEIMMEDVLLPLGLVAPPPPSHQALPASLKHHVHQHPHAHAHLAHPLQHPHHQHQHPHHQRGAAAAAVAAVAAVELRDIPSKKHKATALSALHPLDLQGYHLMYHCIQQQHMERERERDRERERERDRERERERERVVASSAFQPWRSGGKPTPAVWHNAYNALSALPYACQEPPELQNPERVVRSTDRERFERTYQPNVALAPRKSILSKERDKERELERELERQQRLRQHEQQQQQQLEQEQQQQRGELQLHIKQERASTPPPNSAESQSNGSSNSISSNHSHSSNSSSPMLNKPALPVSIAIAPPSSQQATAAAATAAAAPQGARHVPRASSVEEFSAGGSNEITSSTSPVPMSTSTTTTPTPSATPTPTTTPTMLTPPTPPPPPHNSSHNSMQIIATVNQHAKLLPTSSNHHHHSNHSEPSRIRINKNLMSQQPAIATAGAATGVAPRDALQPPQSVYKTPSSTAGYSPTQSSGLNLSTHSSNVVSSPHAKQQQQQLQLQQQQQPLQLQLQQQQQQQHQQSNGNGKLHLGSEFELSTDTDDDSLNGEPDSSAMLPPWELAVEALRDTRPKDRERVLHLLQRLLQENQQYRYNNVQLRELFHKQEAHIVELRDQLQRCRRQLEALDKLRVVPLKQPTTLRRRLEDEEEELLGEEEDLEEEEELMLAGSPEADSNETLTQDQANNNNNHNNNNNNNNNNGELKPNGLRRSPTPLKDEEDEDEQQQQQPPASKRLKLEKTEEEEEEAEQEQKLNSRDKQQLNGHTKSPSPSGLSRSTAEQSEEEEEDEDEELDEELDMDEDEAGAQAPHSQALATPPTATTPISPDSAATAGQLFDSSNSSDASSMKKAQLSACHALAKIASSSSNHNTEETEVEGDENEEAEEEQEEEEEEQQPKQQQRKRQLADESDDDEMPLQQRQQQQQQQRRPRREATTPTQTQTETPALPTPVLMATKASKKQTPPTPTSMITTTTNTTTATAAAGTTIILPTTTTATSPTTTTQGTTNCELQIKKEIV